MTTVDINILAPVIDALQTPGGWIGLLLGLGGRETARAIRRVVRSIRGQSAES